MVGASNFHLLGVGAEKSSLYRLGLLGFDADLIIYYIKGKVFLRSFSAPLLDCWSAAPPYRMNKEWPSHSDTTPYLTPLVT